MTEKITIKEYKYGTYAHRKFYLNGEKIAEASNHKNNCGVGWFNELPEEEENAVEVELPNSEIPEWVEKIISDINDKKIEELIDECGSMNVPSPTNNMWDNPYIAEGNIYKNDDLIGCDISNAIEDYLNLPEAMSKEQLAQIIQFLNENDVRVDAKRFNY